MTPEQLALLQAGAEEVYDPNLRARVLAGELPPEALNPRGATYKGPQAPGPNLGQRVQEKGQQIAGKGRAFLDTFLQGAGAMPLGRLGAIGGMIAPVATAIGEAQENRPTGALGALVGGGAGVATGAVIAKALPGPYGKIAGAVLPAIGGMLGAPLAASGAESIRQKATGEPTKGKEGEFSTQMAMAKQMGELGTTQYRDQMGVYTSALRDLSRDASNQAYLDLQRNIPLINQMKNADLIRQQALLNTQNQAYLQQGVVATAGALATGGQQQTGATVRQALASNPYNVALQSPAISFG